MDVNSVMGINNMNSLLNSVNKVNGSKPSMVPMVGNVDATVKNDYTPNSNFEKNTNAQLQDIFQRVDRADATPLTYNKSGDLTSNKNISLSIDGLSPDNSNKTLLLKNTNSAASSDLQSIFSQYKALETKTFQPNISSALSATIYNSNSTAGSSANAALLNTGNFLNTFV